MGFVGAFAFALVAIGFGVVLIVFRRQAWAGYVSAVRAMFGGGGDWLVKGGSPWTYGVVGVFAIAMGVFVLLVSILLTTGVIDSPG